MYQRRKTEGCHLAAKESGGGVLANVGLEEVEICTNM